MSKAYYNGNFCDESAIRISPRDLGLLRGYAVFDVMPVLRRHPFHADRHHIRLDFSARTLGLSLAIDGAEFAEIASELSRRSGWENAMVRSVLSGGPSEDGFRPVPGQENFFMLIEPAHMADPSHYRDGVSLVTLAYERSLPQVKFANHAVAIQGLERRDEAGAYETLYVSQGIVSECSQSNLFWVQNGKLFTTWDNTLRGITQGLIMELAEIHGRKVAKGSVSLDDLLRADEVFITGSSKAIVPVVRIDDHSIGTGKVGPLTRELMTIYQEYCDQYPGT